MGFVARTSGNFYKILVTLAGLLLVFYILIEFRLWSMEWTEYFLKRGSWGEIIFISLIIAGISMVVLWLFKWHIRLQAGGR